MCPVYNLFFTDLIFCVIYIQTINHFKYIEATIKDQQGANEYSNSLRQQTSYICKCTRHTQGIERTK